MSAEVWLVAGIAEEGQVETVAGKVVTVVIAPEYALLTQAIDGTTTMLTDSEGKARFTDLALIVPGQTRVYASCITS